MSTGSFENFAGTITDIGPLYPFVGSEGVLWVIGLVLWIIWHIIQAKRENRVYDEEVRRYGDKETLKKIIGRESPENP